MNTQKVITQLKQKYPGKKIIPNKDKNPTEILCEIDPTAEHPERSVAIAVIDKSQQHVHKKTTEVYEVIKGEPSVYKDGKEYKLKEGEKLKIKPGEVHSTQGNETWIKVFSEPGWTVEDHILI